MIISLNSRNRWYQKISSQPCGESEWPGTKWICPAIFGSKLNRIDPYHCKSICSRNFIDHRQKAGCEQVLLLCIAIPWIGSSLSNRLVDQYGKFPASNWGWVMAGGAIIYPDSYENSINFVFAKGQGFNMACWKIDQQRFEDFPSYKSSFSSGISQLVMFDSRRTIPMFPYIIDPIHCYTPRIITISSHYSGFNPNFSIYQIPIFVA